jgi:hypothetical protein
MTEKDIEHRISNLQNQINNFHLTKRQLICESLSDIRNSITNLMILCSDTLKFKEEKHDR